MSEVKTDKLTGVGLATGSFGTSSYNTGYVDAELNYNSINGDLA